MKHTGTQELTNLIVNNNSNIYNLDIEQKLSIPYNNNENTYRDIFIDTDKINVVASNNNINEVVDLSNIQFIKSLLLSEDYYNLILNYDNTNIDTFNNTINIKDISHFKQYDINEEIDATAYQDSTDNSYIILLFNSIDEGEELYNKIILYSANNIPIRTKFIDSSLNTYVYMFLYSSIIQNPIDKIIYVYFNDNYSIFNDLTSMDIIKIELNNFILEDNYNDKQFIKLPYHYHELSDLNNLDSNTNVNNGYVKLIDNEIKMPFDYNIYPENIKTKDKLLYKNITNSLLSNRLFIIETEELLFDFEINYTDNTVDLGDEIITEYHYTDSELTINNNVRIKTNNNYTLNYLNNFSYILHTYIDFCPLGRH